MIIYLYSSKIHDHISIISTKKDYFHGILRCQGPGFSGGAADLMKCFDQISRPLARKILETAGFPTNILHAYFDMLDNLTIYNTFAGHIGQQMVA